MKGEKNKEGRRERKKEEKKKIEGGKEKRK